MLQGLTGLNADELYTIVWADDKPQFLNKPHKNCGGASVFGDIMAGTGPAIGMAFLTGPIGGFLGLLGGSIFSAASH